MFKNSFRLQIINDLSDLSDAIAKIIFFFFRFQRNDNIFLKFYFIRFENY